MIIKFIKKTFPLFFAEYRQTKSKIKLAMYALDTVMAIWIFVWLVYILVPRQWYIYHHDSITVYSSDKINEIKLQKLLSDALAQLKKNHLVINEKVKIKIYKNKFESALSMFPGSQVLYLFADPQAGALGHKIFTHELNVTTMEYPPNSKGQKDKFDSVITHELVHVWQAEHYGVFHTYLHLNTRWVKEGYAVYSADQLHLLQKELSEISPLKTVEDFLRKFIEPKSHPGSRAKYYLWGLMVKRAIEDMNISVDDLHNGKMDYDTVLKSLLQKYNISKK